MNVSRPRIAYVMSRFPHLTETFILREMVELDRAGWSVSLYPLILQSQDVVHPDASAWIPRAVRLPFFSARVVGANLRILLEQPARYVSAVAIALAKNLPSPRFFIRTAVLLPKMVYAADRMRHEGIEHVHVHYATHPGLAGWVIHRLTGIPFSITVHGDDVFVNRTMLVPKLRAASFVVAISEFNRRFLSDAVGDWTTRKVRVIRCGVHAPRHRAMASPRLRGQPLEIMSVGALEERKGFRVLLDALGLLVERGVPFRCRIVGEGATRPTLERQIDLLGLRDVVELLGAKTEPEVERLLASANCYVQPSLWASSGKGEGLPVALMEALAASLPAIASSISGIPELIRPGESGWLVPPGDPVAIADAFQAIEADPELACAIATRGRERVCRDYCLETNVQKLAEGFTRP
jgi:glycosyltransferase involved in cell wall biosynthesis